MSLIPKIDELRCFVLDKNPDLVFITETWLKDQTDSNQVNIPEYNMAIEIGNPVAMAAFVYILKIPSSSMF